MLPKPTVSLFQPLCFALLFLLSFTACTKPEPPPTCDDLLGCVTIDANAPIKIGVLQALSGKIAPLGQAQIRGLELALDKRDGKILGHPVVLQIEDTGCTAEGGANAALKIIADPQTVAVFGTTCSGAAATASRAMSAAGLSMISGNNSAPFLTSIAGQAAPNWQPGYFRTAANEEKAGNAAAAYAWQLGLRRAAVIHDTDIYTRGLTESFKKAFVEFGGEIVLDTAVNKGDKEMGPVLQAVLQSQAQVIFFPLFQPEGNHLLLAARKISALEETLMISGGALIEQSFIDSVGKAGKGVCFVGPTRPAGVKVEQVTAAYKAKYKEEPTVSYFLSAYDGAELLFQALEQAAVNTQNADTTLNTSLSIGRQNLRNKLYATSSLQGITGLLHCDQFGDCARRFFQVLRLDDPALGLQGLEENVVYAQE